MIPIGQKEIFYVWSSDFLKERKNRDMPKFLMTARKYKNGNAFGVKFNIIAMLIISFNF